MCICLCCSDLIETLSEDRARLLEEKKKLEEEVNKLKSSNFIPSTYLPPASEPSGACAADFATETYQLVSDTAEEGRLESTMETSMMTVKYVEMLCINIKVYMYVSEQICYLSLKALFFNWSTNHFCFKILYSD